MNAELILQTLSAIMGVVMSLGYFPQAYTLLKKKSSEDVSLSTFLIFGIGTLVWTTYGIVIGDISIIASFGIGVIGSWLVFLLALYYKKRS